MTGSAEETAKKVFGVSGNTRRLGGGMRQCRKVFGSAKKWDIQEAEESGSTGSLSVRQRGDKAKSPVSCISG